MTYFALARQLDKITQKTVGNSSSASELPGSPQVYIPIIKSNWTELCKLKGEVGEKIYQKIIFKEVSMSKMFLNTNLEVQSSLFMAMMGQVIGFLDHPETMDAKLKTLGEQHVRAYKVKTRHFKYFKSSFMGVIRTYIPWTESRETAWEWFWRKIMDNMSTATQANHLIDPSLDSDEVFRRVRLVSDSFDLALTYNVAFSDEFYAQLLETDTRIAALFANVERSVQAVRFLSMLKHMVKLLDDLDTFTEEMTKLARQHRAYGIHVEQLSVFGEVLIKTVGDVNLRYAEKVYSSILSSEDEVDDAAAGLSSEGTDFPDFAAAAGYRRERGLSSGTDDKVGSEQEEQEPQQEQERMEVVEDRNNNIINDDVDLSSSFNRQISIGSAVGVFSEDSGNDDDVLVVSSKQWNKNHEHAWKWLWKILLEIFRKGLEEETPQTS